MSGDQDAICMQASRKIHRPSWMMKPVSSAMGMNSSGEIWPLAGCCQRTRVSKPRSVPSSSEKMGW